MMMSRFRSLVFAGATLAAVAQATSVSAQTSVYYGTMDAADKVQLAQWATHYWARVDAGSTVTPGTFTFTKAAMNDPLFLPVRGARRTLETLGVLNAQACDGLTEVQPGLGDVAVIDALREAMTQWKFRTDAVINPAGTQAHFNLINAAPSTSNTVWGMEGSHLVSTNLPWEALTGANQTGQIASTVSTPTLHTIGKLTDTAPAIAKAAKGVTQTQALITGALSHADRFEDGVVKFLSDQGSNATAWRVDASFGVFGSLPLVGVKFDDAFVLLDTTSGRLDGPFALASPLDATVLLANQSGYVSGTTVRYHNANGCLILIAPSWRPGGPPGVTTPRAPITNPNYPPACPPPGWTLPTPPPPSAWPTRPPCYNPANPAGGWANCTCSSTSGTWFCIVSSQSVGGLPPRIYQTITYYNCGGGATAPAGCPPAGCTIVSQETWY